MTDVQTTDEREPTLKRVPGGWLGRFRCGSARKRVVLAVADERLAYARARKMREVIRELSPKSTDAPADTARKAAEVLRYLDEAAAAPNAPAFNGICRAAVDIAKADPETKGPRTFRDVCEKWLRGEMHLEFPGVVEPQTEETAENCRRRIARHIYPIIGDMAVRNIKQEHYNAVMAALPKSLQCREKIARFMVYNLDHAVRLKLIDKNPIDPATIPPARKPDAIAFTYLYPDEDEQLLSCLDVPLGRRFYYALIVRNGFRSAEAGSLVWGDIDFKAGTCTLDVNKTTPRMWVLDSDVLLALRLFKPDDAEPEDKVFPWYARRGLSAQLRRDLKTAGITRRELFRKTDKRRPLRVHDLRATFVTLAMAAGRNERWVKNRTGHTTSVMLARYERRSTTAIEAGHVNWVCSMVSILWPSKAPKVGRKVGHLVAIQGEKARSSFLSTTADTMQVHAGTQKSRAPDVPAGTRKRVGPPREGGAGQPPADALGALTTAIANATAAGKWQTVARLISQLEGLKASNG